MKHNQFYYEDIFLLNFVLKVTLRNIRTAVHCHGAIFVSLSFDPLLVAYDDCDVRVIVVYLPQVIDQLLQEDEHLAGSCALSASTWSQPRPSDLYLHALHEGAVLRATSTE